ncbi:integrase family protein [Methylobacter sp.]|uniref:integrase family protein n=1 Tax=Methylobacter sp. TaxID=2051955 RepID=UPI0011FC9143|nr:integrase family protein [Methylobacter sp.]TAK64805.1 MAG: DUF4102 domain-containing protein [Methylobacter sp.]
MTKTFVDSLPYPDKGQVFYWDADLMEFGVYAGTTSKTWFVEKRIDNKTKRLSLGKYPVLTAEQAGAKAMEQLSKMSVGIDLVKEKREKKIKTVTLGEVFTAFLDARTLKPKIIEKTELPFSMHDLRRTFVTIAESLDISSFAVKALVNHKQGDDVTSGYIQLNVERLRQPMQIITYFMLKSAGLKQSAEIVPLKQNRG